MRPMRTPLLAALALGALMPSPVSAQSTYVFKAQAVSNSPAVGLGNAGTNAKVGTIGFPAFLEALAKDAGTKKCDLNFQGSVVLVDREILKKIGAAGDVAGDAVFAAGTITIDPASGAVVGGLATLNSISHQSNDLLNYQLIDVGNTGVQALACSGSSAATPDGTGTCGAVCTSEGPGCGKAGGLPTPSESKGQGKIFLYPLAISSEILAEESRTDQDDVFSFGSACTGTAPRTWAECCDDPSLVMTVDLTYSYSADGTKLSATISNPEITGSLDAQLQ